MSEARRLRARRLARLGRWLGPWADPSRSPGGVVQRTIEVPGARSLRARVFRREDEAPTGAMLLVPGLHFRGPEDARMARFASILAHAGHLVLAPHLPDFEALRVAPTVVDDTAAALDALVALPDAPRVRPAIFSISFGSMPALRVASARGAEIATVLVFGGFHGFRSTLRFALAGDGQRPSDPLNAPVVFTNLLPYLDVDDAHRAALAAAFHAQCVETWGRPETREPRVRDALAERRAEGLPAAVRELFLVGARARPGTEARALAALAQAGGAYDWIDVAPHLPGLRADVHLVHGRADDVIPHEESEALLAAMPSHVRARRHLTGLYGHTAHAGSSSWIRAPRAWLDEAASMAAILDALAGASGPWHG